MIDPKVFKQVRKALGLSQQELADALGLSRVTVNKMERGRLRRGIPDEVAERLLAIKERGPVAAKLMAMKQRGPNVKATPVVYVDDAYEDDSHLWDNEEDDQ